MKRKSNDYICTRCRKKKKTVVAGKTLCPECQKWSAPGKGQTNLFGEVIK